MPIKFTVCFEQVYYICTVVGRIIDSELFDSYKIFFESDDWSSEFNELVDLSEACLNDITSAGMQHLASMIGEFAKLRNWTPKVAVYAPSDLPFGIARMYSVEAEHFEGNKVFRNIDDAKVWLT